MGILIISAKTLSLPCNQFKLTVAEVHLNNYAKVQIIHEKNLTTTDEISGNIIYFIDFFTMALCRLNPEQENWLFMNYANKTNKELAEELSEMVKKKNEKQLVRLNQLLNEDFDPCIKKQIQKNIENIKNSSSVSVPLVKRYARKLHCPRKSRMHLLRCNQEKARITNRKRWLDKAEEVDNIMPWLRSIDVHQTRYCKISSEGQLKSIRVSINKFNRYEGYEKGVYLTSQQLPEVGLLRVVSSIYISC